MRFRPYLQVDFRKEPALHCLLFDNPEGLGDLIRRGIELAMAEKNLVYLDPVFQQKFAAQASGLGHQDSMTAPQSEVVAIQAPHNSVRVADLPANQESIATPQIIQPQQAMDQQTRLTEPQAKPIVAKPKPPPGISNFLSKAIADGQ